MTADRPGLFRSVGESTLRNSSTVDGDDGTNGGGAATNGNGNGSVNEDANLNREVAALSNKLISAINHQTQLDDSLASTKHELEMSRAKIKHLEAAAKEHMDMVAKGLLVERKDVEAETQQLMNRLKEERTQRGKAEKDKRNIEQELETLTTALFDEANKVDYLLNFQFLDSRGGGETDTCAKQMVSAARKERDAMDKKNEQLRAQLADTETLLASHQEQLAELKLVMQQMTADNEEADMNMSTGTPSTPALNNRSSRESFARMFESLHLSPNTASPVEIPPTHPTSLSSLIHPVLRHDIGAYADFCEVMHAPKTPVKSSSLPRLSSGSFTSIQVMGMGIGYHSSPSGSPTGLTGGLFGNKNKEVDSRPSSPSSNAPSISNGVAQGQQQTGLGLKETKFWKRVLVEDIEPTLRLDNAPGLSWLARRNVLSAITDGNLVIDPLQAVLNSNVLSCSLCGESRADDEHVRTHRMRTSETQNAQRYPLCGYCVIRTRSVCDFVAFLRTLKEGLWKCDTESAENHAWEESVKLRERMFWSRIGGGVVPAFIYHHSARTSEEQERSRREDSAESNGVDGRIELKVPKRRGSRGESALGPRHDRMPSLTENKVFPPLPFSSRGRITLLDVPKKAEEEDVNSETEESSDAEGESEEDNERDMKRDTITAAINLPLPDDESFEILKEAPKPETKKHAVPGAW